MQVWQQPWGHTPIEISVPPFGDTRPPVHELLGMCVRDRAASGDSEYFSARLRWRARTLAAACEGGEARPWSGDQKFLRADTLSAPRRVRRRGFLHLS